MAYRPALEHGIEPGHAAAAEVSRTRHLATRTGLHPFSREVTLPHVLDEADSWVGRNHAEIQPGSLLSGSVHEP
jgi:hypothetical protein